MLFQINTLSLLIYSQKHKFELTFLVFIQHLLIIISMIYLY